MSLASLFTSALHDTAIVCSFRSLPFLACLLLGSSSGTVERVVASASLLGVVALSHALGLLPLTAMAGAYAYLGVAAALQLPLARALRSRRVTPAALLLVNASLFMLLPAIASPDVVRASALILGWDLLLSSQSFCVETAKEPRSATLRECWLFLLVNPVLVYPERGARVSPAKLHIHGTFRILQALPTILLGVTLLRVSALTHGLHTASAGGPLLQFAFVALFTTTRFLSEYSLHSGLASLQIGMMRQLGYVIPERYNYPLAAKTPLDFWRRWNVYVGSWVRRYVFTPLAIQLGRRVRQARLARAAALLASFAIVGVLHDLSAYALSLQLSAASTVVFVGAACVVMLWLGLDELRSANVAPSFTSSRAAPTLGALAQVAGMAATVALFGWWVR
jgi:hypothetical protein